MEQTEASKLTKEDRDELEKNIKDLVEYIKNATDQGIEFDRYSPQIKELRRLRRMRE